MPTEFLKTGPAEFSACIFAETDLIHKFGPRVRRNPSTVCTVHTVHTVQGFAEIYITLFAICLFAYVASTSYVTLLITLEVGG